MKRVISELRWELEVRLWPTRYHARLTVLRPMTDAEAEAFAATLRGDR